MFGTCSRAVIRIVPLWRRLPIKVVMLERARQWINVTIEEIEETLPNGLHDAEILELVMDYKHARLALEVSVLVGQPIEPHPSCERCRPGEIGRAHV